MEREVDNKQIIREALDALWVKANRLYLETIPTDTVGREIMHAVNLRERTEARTALDNLTDTEALIGKLVRIGDMLTNVPPSYPVEALVTKIDAAIDAIINELKGEENETHTAKNA